MALGCQGLCVLSAVGIVWVGCWNAIFLLMVGLQSHTKCHPDRKRGLQSGPSLVDTATCCQRQHGFFCNPCFVTRPPLWVQAAAMWPAALCLAASRHLVLPLCVVASVSMQPPSRRADPVPLP